MKHLCTHFLGFWRALVLSVVLAPVAAVLYAQDRNLLDNPEVEMRPNILLVVADDLGMFDIGAFGSEIRTPAIDSLAAEGRLFTSFYTSPTCSPTRAMLLSGTDAHAAGLGNMAERTAFNQEGAEGYEGYLSHRVVSVASLLRDAGYRTYMAGKWHLGMSADQLPNSRGFDESFALLQGGASYFNDMMGLTSMMPRALYRHNGDLVESLPDHFYATEFYADFIIDQIQQDTGGGQPFFAYLAFSAPHWPLQVRDEHLGLYRGRYDHGYDQLHGQRINAAKRLGIIRAGAESAPRPSHIKAWSELSPEQQKTQAKAMEIYASVIERMDHHLGRVISFLDETGKQKDTVIVFLSDNGADGSDRSKLKGNDTWLPEAWDLSFENMGRVGSYVYPGAGWARASVGPYRMYKSFLSEGGIRSPAIFSYKGISAKRIPVHEFVTVKDVAPTIMEFAGVSHPGDRYKGRDVRPMTGTSLKSFLDGKVSVLRDDEAFIGWELFGQRAIRKGDWKLLWLSSGPRWLATPESADQWGLFNLVEDPGETVNLVEREPRKFAELLEHWQRYSVDNNVILPLWDNPSDE